MGTLWYRQPSIYKQYTTPAAIYQERYMTMQVMNGLAYPRCREIVQISDSG